MCYNINSNFKVGKKTITKKKLRKSRGRVKEGKD
jgi:hypothetical protein